MEFGFEGFEGDIGGFLEGDEGGAHGVFGEGFKGGNLERVKQH
jgi:hypothetical protein